MFRVQGRVVSGICRGFVLLPPALRTPKRNSAGSKTRFIPA